MPRTSTHKRRRKKVTRPKMEEKVSKTIKLEFAISILKACLVDFGTTLLRSQVHDLSPRYAGAQDFCDNVVNSLMSL